MCQKHHKPTGLHASDYAAGEEYKRRQDMCCDNCGHKSKKYFNCDGDKLCRSCAEEWKEQERLRQIEAKEIKIKKEQKDETNN